MKYVTYSAYIIYIRTKENKKKLVNAKKKQTHRYREQMSVYQWGEGKGKKTRHREGIKRGEN